MKEEKSGEAPRLMFISHGSKKRVVWAGADGGSPGGCCEYFKKLNRDHITLPTTRLHRISKRSVYFWQELKHPWLSHTAQKPWQ